MNLITSFFSLILFSLLMFTNVSCSEKGTAKLSSKDSDINVTNTENKLKFTSGVGAIYEDSKGNLWFGSHSEGVSLYNGLTFRYFTTADGLSSNQVRNIEEDSDGNIWFGTQNGITKYDGKRFIIHKPSETSFSLFESPGITSKKEPMSSHQNQSVTKVNKSDLWFSAGTKDGVIRFDGKELTYLQFPLPNPRNSQDSYSLTDYTKGKDNMTWFATYTNVIGYDGNNFTVIDNKSLNLQKQTGVLHVRSIFEDSKGNLWIGNNGIGVLLKKGDKLIDFTKQQRLASKKTLKDGSDSPKGTLEHVFEIAEDKSGNIWFGDRDTGAWRYDGTTMTNFTTEDGLTTTQIMSIYQSKNGDLLFGMGDGSVCIFNGESFERKY